MTLTEGGGIKVEIPVYSEKAQLCEMCYNENNDYILIKVEDATTTVQTSTLGWVVSGFITGKKNCG